MAKATAECKCAVCGNSFKQSAIKRNRTEADEWKAWAECHITECMECYKKRMKIENREKAALFDLPEIEGKSEKQIAYAEDVRAQYIAANEDRIKEMQAAIVYADTEECRRKCAESGLGNPPDVLKWNMYHSPIYKAAYICLTENRAWKIINTISSNTL